MARLPSFDSEIEKARADAQALQDHTLRLCAVADDLIETKKDDVATGRAELDGLREAEKSFRLTFVTVVTNLAARVDRTFADFESGRTATRYERWVAFFSSRRTTARRAANIKKRALGRISKAILFDAQAVQTMFVFQKQFTDETREALEPKLVKSIDERRMIVASIDDARHRGKEVALRLSTVQRKITNAPQDSQLSSLQADEADILLEQSALQFKREKLVREHDGLDRQAIWLGDVIDILNERLAICSILLTKLIAEMERCIQLHHAVEGTLAPLIAELRTKDVEAEGGAGLEKTPAAFLDLLTLHEQGGISLAEIEKRKARADEALRKRLDVTSTE